MVIKIFTFDIFHLNQIFQVHFFPFLKCVITTSIKLYHLYYKNRCLSVCCPRLSQKLLMLRLPNLIHSMSMFWRRFWNILSMPHQPIQPTGQYFCHAAKHLEMSQCPTTTCHNVRQLLVTMSDNYLYVTMSDNPTKIRRHTGGEQKRPVGPICSEFYLKTVLFSILTVFRAYLKSRFYIWR